MTKFGEYIERCTVAKYADKYIAYNVLKEALERRTAGMLDGMQAFYPMLDQTYTTCRNFADQWADRLLAVSANSDSVPLSVGEILELNQFVHLNQEALRKIVKKHDKNNPTCRLLLTWRYPPICPLACLVVCIESTFCQP